MPHAHAWMFIGDSRQCLYSVDQIIETDAMQDTVVLHEAVASSSGETTQIIFQRNADISPPDLVELIEKVGASAFALLV